MEQRARNPICLTYCFLCRITLHAFQHDFQFEFWRIAFPLIVHLRRYLSLFACLLYQVPDNILPASIFELLSIFCYLSTYVMVATRSRRWISAHACYADDVSARGRQPG